MEATRSGFRAFSMAAAICFVGVIPPASAAEADAGEVRRMLSDRPWAAVAARENVKFGLPSWAGPEDLSFQYRLAVREGNLWLWVSVTDDKPCVRGKKWPVSDHVELWLADPALARDFEERAKGVLETIAEFEERLKDDSCNDMEREFLERQRELLAKLKKDKHFTQFIFDGCGDSRYYGGQESPREGQYTYLLTDTGCDFFGRIPLYGAFDMKAQVLDRLGFMVDVVDVDDAGAARQESLLSSSPGRIYGDASTFRMLKPDAPFRLPLESCERLRSEVAGDGFWRRASGGYEFVAWGEEAWSGCYGVDRSSHAGIWEPLPPALRVPPDYTASVLPSGHRLLVTKGGQCTVLDLGEKVHAAGGMTWAPLFWAADPDSSYLVVDVTGLSRWPGGSTMCGAGTESDLIWVKMDKAMKVLAADSFHYESCFESIDVEEHTIGSRTVTVRCIPLKKGGSVRSSATYDYSKPALGLVRGP